MRVVVADDATDYLILPAERAGVYGTIAEALVSLGFLAARTRRLELSVSRSYSRSATRSRGFRLLGVTRQAVALA